MFIASLLLLISCQQKTSESNRNQKEFEARNPDFTFQFESELKKIYEENELFGDFIFTVVDENGLVFWFIRKLKNKTGLNRSLVKP